jgi:site-specific recombinase XerD
LWVEGTLEGQRVRNSLDTANWEIASDKLLKMEVGENPERDCSVADAVKNFLDDCELRNLNNASTVKYRQTLHQLSLFALAKDISTVRALADLETLKKFVSIQADSPRTLGKKIERVRTFLRHCEELGWCASNPALKIKKPIVRSKPVVPFTSEEYQKILKAIEKYPTRNSFGYDNHRRLRAFIYVLRYTGLRISDVVKLPKSAVSDSRVLLRTQAAFPRFAFSARLARFI